jgi:cytochrome P450
MAGYETTSQTLSYTIWELARHPDVQARLRAEIMEYEGRELSYDEIGTLPYLNAVCQETSVCYLLCSSLA